MTQEESQGANQSPGPAPAPYPLPWQLLSQVSAIGLMIVGTIYLTGMLSFALQAHNVGIARNAAYSYLSMEMILGRGLGLVVSPQFLAIVFALAILAQTVRLFFSIPPFVEWDETFRRSMASHQNRHRKRPKVVQKVLRVYMIGFPLVLLGAIIFAPAGVGLVVLSVCIYMLLVLRFGPKVPMKWRKASFIGSVIALSVGVAFLASFMVRPPLPIAELTVKGAPDTVRAELWVQTPDTWVLIRGSVLTTYPSKRVITADIKRTDANWESRNLAHYTWNLIF